MKLMLLLACSATILTASCMKADNPAPARTNTSANVQSNEWDVKCDSIKNKKPFPKTSVCN